MAYYNRNNQGYQQREISNSTTQGWFPNSQEIKRGETAPTEKGKRERVIANNQQNAQLIQFSAVAAASGFQLSNTSNLKEAIGKFKSSPYYSSVVNQQNQKKQQQQHYQQQNSYQSNQGIDFAKMSKKEHIQQISRIYQNNPTNILHTVQHNSNNLQSGGGTTTNKKAQTNNHGLDPYSSNNIPQQRYSFKLPQRPSTSHDQQSVQRKQNQIQTTTQYRNTQMSITNTDGFGLKKPSTPGTGSRVATAGQRGSKLLNTSGNSLLNSSLNAGISSKGQQQHQNLNTLHPLQIRNTSAGVTLKSNAQRRETFASNTSNNQNTSFNKEVSNHRQDLLPKYNTHQDGDFKQNHDTEHKTNTEQYPNQNQQVKVHHTEFKKDSKLKQNFFTHENFYSQGSTSSQKQDNSDKKSSLNKSGAANNNTFLNESFSNKQQNSKSQQQQQLLKIALPQEMNTSQQMQYQQNSNYFDNNSEENTPRIIVTGNQKQQTHKIQFIENSFTKYGEDEDETTTKSKNIKQKQRSKANDDQYIPSDDKNQQRHSHNHEEEGDDEHEDDQEDDEEYYQNYYNHHNEEDNEYRQQYAVPYDEDDEDEEEYDEDDEQEDNDEDEENYHHEDQENDNHHQNYQYFQHGQNKADSSDEHQLQNFIQDVGDDFQCQQHEEDDQFGEKNIQKYMKEKVQNQKESIKINTNTFSVRPMTTEGGKRRRGVETPVQNQQKQVESKDSNKDQNIACQQQQKADQFDFHSQALRRQSQKENFNGLEEDHQNQDSFNDDQHYGQEFRIDFDTQQFERPPERGKQYIGNRGPIKVDHDLIKEDSFFKDCQAIGKRPPSRHRIPNRAAGLGIPTQDLQEIPIKNMYDKDEPEDHVSDQNRKFLEGQKLQLDKVKQSYDSEEAFINFDIRNFGENQSRKNSSRQPVPIIPKTVNNQRPMSGNVKTRALNKKESFDQGMNINLPEKTNLNNEQTSKIPNHPVSAKYPKKSGSINQKENDQLWDEFDEILNDKQANKNIIRKLEGSDILIKHNVSSTINSKASNSNSQSIKVPFETSLGQDFLSLFANNYNEN
ncbi:hypothetical protein TTHERM_00037480 (macronuclear) [Tetrahymena thermophila SB210]|uniref:Uncharacterized protein n=1 Tax=Tetrahymena thermophila (strain SB210) TaxID=312017 RepID=Q22M71_TETTS|nr:hypothetical protein TTHERM_00037480 [Tetrahymena thermophila SB210]EAR86361.2 hypothetical protein TTHERM_00037480 [Tetrahymena thermophila SB210]|eukprot:XP_977149.2 hypothetical protein TTHERM_00037480 [Tetrahymena thermophila SB210]